MRHVRMLGPCLAAVLALAAIMASSAVAATPEWGKCEAKAGGKYKDSNCLEKAKKGQGAFEWHKGVTLKNVPFTGHSSGSGGVLTTGLAACVVGEEASPEDPYYGKRVTRKKCEEADSHYFRPPIEIKIECEAETNTGEATGKNKVANVKVIFTGCALFGYVPCQSAGAAEGEVRVNTLQGELGYLKKGATPETTEVGVKLTPTKKKAPFAEFACNSGDSIVVGVGNSKEGAWYEPESKGGNDAIISPITPIDTNTSKYTQVFTVNEESENVPNAFEGKPKDLLEDYVSTPGFSTLWEPAGEEVTNVNSASEEGEIKTKT